MKDLYVRKNDCLIIRRYDTAGVKIRVELLMLDPNDRLVGTNYDLTADLSVVFLDNFFKNIGPGYIQSLYVSIINGSSVYGQTYVEVVLQNGEIQDNQKVFRQLVKGYITNAQSLSYPEIQRLTDFTLDVGPPVYSVSSFIISPPFIFTGPTGLLTRWKNLHVQYIADGTAVNRFLVVRFPITIPGPVTKDVFVVKSKIAQTAGQTIDYYIGGVEDTAGAVAIDNSISIRMDPQTVDEGRQMIVTASGAAAGDTLNVAGVGELWTKV